MNAPAERASVSRSEESPDVSATFDTAPFTPKSVAATIDHRVADDRPPVARRLPGRQKRLGHARTLASWSDGA